MKRFSIAVMAAAAFFALWGCSKGAKLSVSAPASAAQPGDVAAAVGGETITMGELNDAAKSQLQRVDTEVYQIKKRVLDDLVEAKLIEEAAKKKGMSADKFLTEEIDAKVTAPADSDIQAVYDSSKERLGKPLEEVKGQITEYLKQSRKAQARGNLIAELKKVADVKINIEPPRVTIDTKGAPSVGDKDAKITFVEFSDYQCPFCKRVRPTIWRLTDEYKGKVRYVFMDFPLSFHKDSKKAHEAAHCAGDQGKYFEYNKAIFDNQTNIGVEDLKKYAKELKLNTKDFDKCLTGGKHARTVEDSVAAASKIGVTGTPAYFINGIMLSGAMPYESFKDVIESELKK
ncbi:MAG: thioredoxin domain-containing protein [Pseudomonadota bacterium]